MHAAETMELSRPSSVGDRYVLGTGEAAAYRLRVLNALYGPSTAAFLRRAGLQAGMRVADIGCGSGTVSCWIARKVGPDGQVVGVDASAAQLAQARMSAAAAGLNQATFVEASVYGTGLPRGAFDLVYCRFLLIHLTRPDDGLREMAELVKSGGVLACEDFEADLAYCEPPSAAMERFHELACALCERRGLDWRLGRSLFPRFRAAGFREPELSLSQPVAARGEQKLMPALTLAEMAPALFAERLLTPEQFQHLHTELRALAADDSIVLAAPRMTQVWARKP